MNGPSCISFATTNGGMPPDAAPSGEPCRTSALLRSPLTSQLTDRVISRTAPGNSAATPVSRINVAKFDQTNERIASGSTLNAFASRDSSASTAPGRRGCGGEPVAARMIRLDQETTLRNRLEVLQ